LRNGDELPKGFILCPGSCKRCNLCKIDVPHNIAFRKH
jgi:predicted metal-binding protein